MSNLRQTILVRTDLNFPLGLMCAQVAHIHMEKFRNHHIDQHKIYSQSVEHPTVRFVEKDLEWLKSPYIFVHGAPNKETLDYFIKKAESEKIDVDIWQDTVYSKVGSQDLVFDTVVGASLGPDDSDKIKKAIGDLPLL